MRISHDSTRPGVTLIELLLVISVMLALALIALAVIPDALNRSRTADGAERLQEWLLTSKQRALRDKAPRGLRLIPETLPNGDVVCRRLEYIEVPDSFAPPGTLVIPQSRFDPSSGSGAFQTHEITLRGGGDIRPFVEPGDLLELVETGGVYQVWPIDAGNGVTLEYPAQGPPDTTRFLVLPQVREARLAPFIAFEKGFRFIRQPKPLMGEDVLELPSDIVIWLQHAGAPVSLGLTAQPPFDVTFSPGGPVQPARQGRIVLWVRHYPLDERDPVGDPTLITIYSRTGAIAAHPVFGNPNVPAADSYRFTQDGRNSGL